jgi:hypothetical protein
MIKIVKVTGKSLSPVFLSGDYVITGNSPFLFGEICVGDTVVFSHPSYGLMIKNVHTVDSENEQILVEGNHSYSLASDQIGPINLSTIFGKVLFHVKKPLAFP